MSEDLPGSREHVIALREASPRELPVGVAPHLGSKLHREVISHKIKPGTVAYRAAMAAAADDPAEVLVLTFVGEGTAGNAGKAHFTAAGGIAPYSFDPGDGEDAVEVAAAGAFYYDYATDDDFTATITDSATPQRVQTDSVELTVDWNA